MGRADAIEWTPELETNVLDSIESGDTLRQAAQKNGISHQAILRHVASSQSFADHYARVLEIRTDADFDGLIDRLAVTPETNNFGAIDGAWVQWQRVQIDTLKWALSKRNPKKYGERIQQEVTGKDGGPLQIVSTIPRPTKEGS